MGITVLSQCSQFLQVTPKISPETHTETNPAWVGSARASDTRATQVSVLSSSNNKKKAELFIEVLFFYFTSVP
jgi:hypothetical protein